MIGPTLAHSFNPRSRAGANHPRRHQHVRIQEVSIRAPVRERIPGRRRAPRSAGCFNPRSRAGANALMHAALDRDAFQSALPCGSECTTHVVPAAVHRFNPRSRAGANRRGRSSSTRPGRFNPRSRAGANASRMIGPGLAQSFNPRSRAGANRAGARDDAGPHVSIRAPVRERMRSA